MDDTRDLASGTLYHGTTDISAARILAEGMPAGSYWASYRCAEYYASEAVEAVEMGEVSEAAILSVDLSQLDPKLWTLDNPSIAEPLAFILEQSEDDLYERYEKTEGTPLDCLNIYESVKYRGSIPASAISVDYDLDIALTSPWISR
jgi:hypothetical protein